VYCCNFPKPSVKLAAAMRARAATALVALALGAGAVYADTPPERVVRYGKDALTVRLERVPLTEVIDEIGRQSGAQIRGQLRDPREVSADFEAVALPEALHRLLGSQNFALIYGDRGELRVVKLLGGPHDVVGTPGPSTAVTSTLRPLQPAALLPYLDIPLPVRNADRVQELLETTTPTLRQLMGVAVGNDDTSIRAEAVRAGLDAMETEPELKATVARIATMDNDTLSGLVRAMAKDRAEELMGLVAANARGGELRAKANTILQALPGFTAED
jgi:hypothetical protein